LDSWFDVVFCCSAFLQEFRNWERLWSLEAMHTVTLEIRLLAKKVSGVTDLGVWNFEYWAHVFWFIVLV
jgi:hypothetical protein